MVRKEQQRTIVLSSINSYPQCSADFDGTSHALVCWLLMRISDKKLLHDLEVLRHGGDEAVELFFAMGQTLFRKGGIDFLDNWIDVAAPSLPERDRHAVMSALMRRLFAGSDAVSDDSEQPTLQ